MSTEARSEAIDIIAGMLEGLGAGSRAAAEAIVAELEKTHTIVRRSPRVHRPTDDAHPRQQITRAGEVREV